MDEKENGCYEYCYWCAREIKENRKQAFFNPRYNAWFCGNTCHTNAESGDKAMFAKTEEKKITFTVNGSFYFTCSTESDIQNIQDDFLEFVRTQKAVEQVLLSSSNMSTHRNET